MSNSEKKTEQNPSLSKLSKSELLGVMLEQEKENELLRQRIDELTEKLADAERQIETSRSLSALTEKLGAFMDAATADKLPVRKEPAEDITDAPSPIDEPEEAEEEVKLAEAIPAAPVSNLDEDMGGDFYSEDEMLT